MDKNVAPAPTAAVPAAASTVEEELKAKQAALQKAQDEIARQTQEANALQSQIKALQAKITEVQQALAGYEASSQAMAKQLNDAKNLIAQKAGIAEAVIKDDKVRIDQKIADFDQALVDQGKKVQEALSGAETATAAVKEADAVALQKQVAYDTIKKSPKDTGTALRDLVGLLDQANKVEAQSDYIALYFLITEAKALASKIQIPSPEDYAASLRTAQTEVERAKLDALDKKAKADQLAAAYSDAKQKYDAAQASRRTDLLAALKKAGSLAA